MKWVIPFKADQANQKRKANTNEIKIGKKVIIQKK